MDMPTVIEKDVVLDKAACLRLEALLHPDPSVASLSAPSIVSPLTLLGEVSGQVGLFSRSAADGTILLHEAQTLTQTGPLTFDTAHTLRVDVDPTSELGRAARFETKLRDAQGANVLQMETRLRWMAREQISGLVGPSFQQFARSQSLDLEDGVIWRPSRRVVDEYLRLSGDENPAHTDDATARALGLSAAVVPGMLLLARIESLLRNTFKTAPAMLRARFVGFVEIGAEVRIVVPRPTDSGDAREPRTRVVLVGPNERICAIVDAKLGLTGVE